ncbi:MAG: hypothetical protein DHS20C17_06810 [Cyclobacteriaceae bacterium]|nr:MAG: hypothetical protein DHS20C17_06810 [Cyclobacteriaceae bacterium]
MVKQYSRQIAVWFVPISLLLLYSCGKPKPADTSLSLDNYLDLGLPDPENVWGFDQFNQAFSTLTRLKIDSPFALPLKTSARSGMIYDRMVSIDNLSFLQDTSISLSTKAHTVKNFLRVYSDLMNLYTNVLMEKQYYHREIIGVHLFGLEVSEKMLTLADRINQSNSPEDVALQSGYASIQGIYYSVLQNLLEAQKNTELYMPEDLELLSDRIKSSITTNQGFIGKESAEGMVLAMKEITELLPSGQIKGNYEQLIVLLEKIENNKSKAESFVN